MNEHYEWRNRDNSGSNETIQASNRLILTYFFTLWAFIAACSNGYLSADPDTRYAVAEALVYRGEINIERGNRVEHDGKHYAVFFPGQTIEFLPFAVAQRLASSVTSLDQSLLSRAFGFAASLILIPASGAIAIIGFMRVLRQLGSSLQTALLLSTALLITTPLWIFSGNGSEEPMLAALSIWTVSVLLEARAMPSRATDRLGVACILIAIGLLHRATFISFAVGASFFAVQIIRELGWKQVLRPKLAIWLTIACLLVSLIPLYNWMRFGSPMDTGYAKFDMKDGGPFATPLMTGLIGNLVSPGKSLFLYTPLLLACPIALLYSEVRARLRPLAGLIIITLCLHLYIYSKSTYWGGDMGWGNRYHVSILPLALIPVALLFASHAGTLAARRVTMALAIASMSVQLIGLPLAGHVEQSQHPEYLPHMIPGDNAWTWKGSQIPLRIKNLKTKLSNHDLDFGSSHIKLQSKIAASAWNFFPVRGATMLGNGSAAAKALWLLWLFLVAACVVGIRTCIRRMPPAAVSGMGLEKSAYSST
jgi:hypothetical protein